MTRVELVSLFWCLIFGGILVGVIVATIRMGLDEQREREKCSQCGSVHPRNEAPECWPDPPEREQ